MYRFMDKVEIIGGFFEGIQGVLIDVVKNNNYHNIKKYLMMATSGEAEEMEIEVEEDEIRKIEEGLE